MGVLIRFCLTNGLENKQNQRILDIMSKQSSSSSSSGIGFFIILAIVFLIFKAKGTEISVEASALLLITAILLAFSVICGIARKWVDNRKP
jgi:hypothetical protein